MALAMGFLAGSLLPATDVERERLRPIRDKVVDRARATTSDLFEAGKAVVAETAQSGNGQRCLRRGPTAATSSRRRKHVMRKRNWAARQRRLAFRNDAGCQRQMKAAVKQGISK